MKGFNLIVVFDQKEEKILMCKRKKSPYKGLKNFVGGKIEGNENHLDGAYRELREETGIMESDIELHHFMDFTYYYEDLYIEVYMGILKHPVQVYGDENELLWVGTDEDFFDSEQYAGEGNIGHILNHMKHSYAKGL